MSSNTKTVNLSTVTSKNSGNSLLVVLRTNNYNIINALTEISNYLYKNEYKDIYNAVYYFNKTSKEYNKKNNFIDY